jgi:hypothetical protein
MHYDLLAVARNPHKEQNSPKLLPELPVMSSIMNERRDRVNEQVPRWPNDGVEMDAMGRRLYSRRYGGNQVGSPAGLGQIASVAVVGYRPRVSLCVFFGSFATSIQSNVTLLMT